MSKIGNIDLDTVTLVEPVTRETLMTKRPVGAIGTYHQSLLSYSEAWHIEGLLDNPTQAEIESLKNLENPEVHLIEINEPTIQVFGYGKVREVRLPQTEGAADIIEYSIEVEGCPAIATTHMQTADAYLHDLDYRLNLKTFDPHKGRFNLKYVIGQLVDHSGTGNHGKSEEVPHQVAGKFGLAGDFDGSADEVQVPNDSSLDQLRTVMFWIKPHSVTSRGILQKYGSSGNRPLNSALNSSQKIKFLATFVSYGNSTIYSNNALTANTWYHIAWTYDGTDTKLYIDAVLQTDTDNIGSDTLETTTEPLRIGYAVGVGNTYFDGLIDDVAVYDAALNQSQIQDAMNGTFATSGLKGHWKFDERTGCAWEFYVDNDKGSAQTVIIEIWCGDDISEFNLWWWTGSAWTLIGNWGGDDAWSADKNWTDPESQTHNATEADKDERGATVTGIGTITRMLGTKYRVLLEIPTMALNDTDTSIIYGGDQVLLRAKLLHTAAEPTVRDYTKITYIDGGIDYGVA